MILSAQSIRKLCVDVPTPLISPFVERSVHLCGLSYGLTSAGYDIRTARALNIAPRSYVLASSIEKFFIPLHLKMKILDKSTWARRGIVVQNTTAEPGWYGYLTLEVSNEAKDWQFIEEGSPIAQVEFELLDEPTEQPYSGKYQDQAAGPQPARLESSIGKV